MTCYYCRTEIRFCPVVYATVCEKCDIDHNDIALHRHMFRCTMGLQQGKEMHMMRCPYQNNPFCSRMTDADRSVICPHCHAFRFYKKVDAQESCRKVGQQLEPGIARCTVMLEGLISTNSARNADMPKAFLLWQPGDILGCENIFDIPNELESIYHRTYLQDGAYAVLRAEDLRQRFMQSSDFAALLYQTLNQTHLRQTTFLLGTRFHDAVSRLKYLLLFCQENRISNLTHQDLAYLADLNRTTVTKTLKQILAREDLSISLKDYIRSLYEEG